jgi:hypothetical protein
LGTPLLPGLALATSARALARLAATMEDYPMMSSPSEVSVDSDGRVELPMSVLVEAGINPGERLLASSDGDGRITLRRLGDAIADLLNGRPL